MDQLQGFAGVTVRLNLMIFKYESRLMFKGPTNTLVHVQHPRTDCVAT